MAMRRQLKGVGGSTKANGINGTAERSTSPSSRPENIFLFIPNLIGYSRVVLAIASLYYMPLHPRTCFFLYSISCLLDALDGAAARKFEQTTRFGAALDMVIDRCTTSCLLVFLASVFPRWIIVFQGLISLDLASHYIHMFATLAMGGSSQSHKKMDEKRPWAMRIYYTNPSVLFTVCALNELFFIALYLLSFSSPVFMSPLIQLDGKMSSLETGNPAAPSLIWTTPWSAGAMEMARSAREALLVVAKYFRVSADVLHRANKMDSTVPWILLCVSCLFMAFKQYVNVVQMIEASIRLAEGDIETRKKASLPRRRNLH